MEIVCNKVKFATKRDAEFHINKLLKRIPSNCYLCPKCNVWHLTKNKQGNANNKYDLKFKKIQEKLLNQASIITGLNKKISEMNEDHERYKSQVRHDRAILDNRIRELKEDIRIRKERYKQTF